MSFRYALEEARINLSEESQRHRLSELAEGIQLFEAGSGEMHVSISLPDKGRADPTGRNTGTSNSSDYWRRSAFRAIFRDVPSPADYLRRRHAR